MLRFARRVPGYAGLRLRDEVLSRAFLDMTFAVHFSRGSNRSICPHFVPKSLFFRRPRHPLGFTAPPAGVHRATSPQPRYSPGLGHTRPAAPSARGRATRRQPRHPPAAAQPAGTITSARAQTTTILPTSQSRFLRNVAPVRFLRLRHGEAPANTTHRRCCPWQWRHSAGKCRYLECS